MSSTFEENAFSDLYKLDSVKATYYGFHVLGPML
jgi:hypothetical protein